MVGRWVRLNLAVGMALAFAVPQPGRTQGIITEVFLGGIEDKANSVTDHAAQKADYLIQQTARAMLDFIKAWKEANSKLLDQGFDRLDGSLQNTFNNFNTVLDRIQNGEEVTFGDLQQLNSNIASALSRLPGTPDDAEVYGYRPRVVLPTGLQTVPMHIVGPKLGSANVTVSLSGESVPADGIGPEVIAKLDRSKIPFKDHEQTLVEYDVLFTAHDRTMFHSEKPGRGKLTVAALPKVMAHVLIDTHVWALKTDPSSFKKFVGATGKDTGADQDVLVPPDLANQGYVINVTKWKDITWDDNNGDGEGGSHCSGPVRESISPQGFKFHFDLGHTGGMVKGHAHQNCNVYVPVEHTYKISVPAPQQSIDLGWSADVPVKLPAEFQSPTITVQFFDGRTSVMGPNQYSNNKLLSVDLSGDTLIFRPHPPGDF